MSGGGHARMAGDCLEVDVSMSGNREVKSTMQN